MGVYSELQSKMPHGAWVTGVASSLGVRYRGTNTNLLTKVLTCEGNPSTIFSHQALVGKLVWRLTEALASAPHALVGQVSFFFGGERRGQIDRLLIILCAAQTQQHLPVRRAHKAARMCVILRCASGSTRAVPSARSQQTNPTNNLVRAATYLWAIHVWAMGIRRVNGAEGLHARDDLLPIVLTGCRRSNSSQILRGATVVRRGSDAHCRGKKHGHQEHGTQGDDGDDESGERASVAAGHESFGKGCSR